jgi:hypothetical protein
VNVQTRPAQVWCGRGTPADEVLDDVLEGALGEVLLDAVGVLPSEASDAAITATTIRTAAPPNIASRRWRLFNGADGFAHGDKDICATLRLSATGKG